jgi:hypothetical protein
MLLLQRQAVEVSCLGSSMLGGDAGVCAGPAEAADMMISGEGAMHHWAASGNASAAAAMPDGSRHPQGKQQAVGRSTVHAALQHCFAPMTSQVLALLLGTLAESVLCGMAPFPIEAHLLNNNNNNQNMNKRSFANVGPTSAAADDSPLTSLASAHSAAWSYHRATGPLGTWGATYAAAGSM